MSQMLEKMSAAGHNVTHLLQKDMNHCDIDGHKDAFDAWCNFIIKNAEKFHL